MEDYLKILSAVNDGFRITLLLFLQKNGKSCVCEMQHSLDVKQSRLSLALKILHLAGFISVHRKGRWAYYEIEPKTMIHRDFLAHIQKLNIKIPPKTYECETKFIDNIENKI